MSGFRFIDYRGDRPVISDVPEGEMKKFVTLDCDMSDEEFIKMIDEVNRKGCRPVCKDEPMCPNYEPMEHINKAVLTSRYYLDEFVQALINEGYKVMLEGTAKEDEVVITWKDKNDLMEEIKREARKIEAER